MKRRSCVTGELRGAAGAPAASLPSSVLFHYRKELREDQYDKADDYHKNKMIIMRTTELLINDLDLYYKALDQ